MKAQQILKDLIAFESVNNPQNGCYPSSDILDYIIDLLTSWNSDIEVKKFSSNKYSSIYAFNPLRKASKVLFMGHLDVVPVSNGWNTNPFILHIDSDRAYGRGTKDCKGSVLSSLLAYKSLCEENNTNISSLGFFLSTDEETGGTHGAKEFFNYAKKNKILPTYILNVDGGAQVVYKRRAGFGVKITIPPNLKRISGNKETIICSTNILGDNNRHSAYFIRGADRHAVISLSKLLHVNPDWQVSRIDGSWVKGNVIPDDAEIDIVKPSKELNSQDFTIDNNLTQFLRMLKSIILIELDTDIVSDFGITVNPNILEYDESVGLKVHFDVRAFLSSSSVSSLIQAFEKRLGTLTEKSRIECSGSSGYFHTPKDNILVKTASSVLKEHNLPYLPCEQEGASDARYASELGIPVVDIGPKGGHVHGNDEFIDLKSMIEFGVIYKEIIDKLV